MSDGALLPGCRVLIVEDEVLVSMLFEEALIELGCQIVGPAATREKALGLARIEQLDAALLDVNLGGDPVYPVADILASRGIPFAFVTGYGQDGVDGRYAHAKTLSKPFQLAVVEQVIRSLVGRGQP